MNPADILAAAVRVADYGVLLARFVRDKFQIPMMLVSDPDMLVAFFIELDRQFRHDCDEIARLWGSLAEQIAEAEYDEALKWDRRHDDDDDSLGLPTPLEAAAVAGAVAGAELADDLPKRKKAKRVFRQLRGKKNLVLGQTHEQWLRATADSAIKRAKRIFGATFQQIPEDGKLTNVQVQSTEQVTQAVSRANRTTELQMRGAARMTAAKAAQVGHESAFGDDAKSVLFVAVLDERTTPMCQELSGTVWPAGSSDIQRPPIHYGCRSMLVPVYSDQPPQPYSYAAWIKGQPSAVQDRVLGKARGKMLRKGKTLHELIRDGRYIRVRKPTAA